MTPVQLVAGSFEVGLLLAGAALLLWMLFSPAKRAAWLGVNRLPPWAITGYEAALLFVTIFLCGLVGQGVVGQLLAGEGLARLALRGRALADLQQAAAVELRVVRGMTLMLAMMHRDGSA